MKSNRTLAVALATLSLLSSCVLNNALGEESSAWREAKKAFAPLNVLRIGASEEEKNAEEGTTVRVFGIDRGEDLTVFPPVKEPAKKAANESEKAAESAVEPEVVGVKISSQAAAGETSATVVHSQLFDQQAELISLPVVEPSMDTQLASSQANQRVAFATQAYMAEESAGQATTAPVEGEYVQGDGTVEWGPPVSYGGAGCCDSCCTGCCDGCCGCQPCCPPKIMVVGVEAVFLSPDINGTPVNYLYEDFATPETVQFGPAFGQAALDDLYGAPRISVGCQGCKWGIVGRYFHLRAGEHDHDFFDLTAVPPPTEHSYDVNSILEAYYTDLELTRNFCLHGCKNQFSFGVRYALIEHHESLYARSNTQDGLLAAYARRNRQAHGTGLTFGLNGRKPLFPCSCVHWFYNARGSVLWGCSHNEVESEARVLTTAGGATVAAAGSIDGAIARVDDDLFIGEIQAGLQWDFALRCLPAKAFFRTAFEYQYWDASLGGAGSASFAGVQNGGATYQVTAGSFAPGLIVDFVGFSIGSGFTW